MKLPGLHLAWSLANRSALLRVPAKRGVSTRVELRSPDPACNPYLAFAAIFSFLLFIICYIHYILLLFHAIHLQNAICMVPEFFNSVSFAFVFYAEYEQQHPRNQVNSSDFCVIFLTYR